MRLTATFISIFLLFATGCTVDPKSKVDNRAELNKLKGPEVGSIEANLLSEAEQAVSIGDFRHATQSYKELLDKDPKNKEYALALADSMRRSGDNANALKVLDDLLKKDPDNAAALEDKGLCLMNTGEFAEAGQVFEKVMKIDDKRWRTLNGIAILFTMKNMSDNAIAYYQAALNISTDNPSVLNNMGLTLAMDRQYDQSYDAFRRAKRHLPAGSADIKNIDLNLALVYAIAGKLDDAEQTAAPHLSKAGLYNNMGFYAYLAKNTELAKSYLNMALTQSPVYYERAWKNLSAVSGENAAESNDNNAVAPEQQKHGKSKVAVIKPEDDAGNTSDKKPSPGNDKQELVTQPVIASPKVKSEKSLGLLPNADELLAKDPTPSKSDTKNDNAQPIENVPSSKEDGQPAPAATPIVGVPLDDIPASKPKTDQ